MTRIPFLLGYAALETGPQAAGSILALDDTPSHVWHLSPSASGGLPEISLKSSAGFRPRLHCRRDS